MNNSPLHKFHIPVLGLAYSIDSPIKVARFGIASVISIVEDKLIETMRRHYYSKSAKTYFPIPTNEEDFRAKRITDYLNLVNEIVQTQVEKLKAAAFEAGSDIVKYFEMLPDDSTLKNLYNKMMETAAGNEKAAIAAHLRSQIKPGSIDVNIMTKVDRDIYNKKGAVIEHGSDAVASLRAYAKSDLQNSAVIFSAGLNPRLYNYLEHCEGFLPDAKNNFIKRVIVKVSDYRSALIQGKYLAKKGIWVSEFRIESGLNCGGHAFATDGYLLGPILEEFKIKKEELTTAVFEIYNKAVQPKINRSLDTAPAMHISVQGGIGTQEEAAFLQETYLIESTGWGTPFLLVPEATTVDEETLKLLCAAKADDIKLSKSSPLGVRFYNLENTTAQIEKKQRILNGKPGSPCTEKHLAFNTEFTEKPICTASQKYQKLKIAQIEAAGFEENEQEKQINEVLEKECICVGLSNAASINYEAPFVKKLNAVSICPGPNLANFSQVVSLQTMVDHIYGRVNIMTNPERPHVFIAELKLYINYLKEQLTDVLLQNRDAKLKKYISNFYQNLQDGITYYRQLAAKLPKGKNDFISALAMADAELITLNAIYKINE